MSDKRTTIFTTNIYEEIPLERELIGKLKANGFMQNNLENKFTYLLSTKFTSLLNLFDNQIEVWIECFDEFEIQIGSDSQELIEVKSEDGRTIFGGSDFAYDCIGKLHENIDAKYIDASTQEKYFIRNLDFSNFVAIGKTFIHFEAYFEIPDKFLIELEKILNCKLRYAKYRS